MLSFKCIDCTLKKLDYILDNYVPDNDKRMKLREEAIRIIEQSPDTDTSPYLNARIMRFLENRLGLGDIYFDIKREYNKYLLSIKEEILTNIENSGDRLLAALKYAMTGNFIDFGIMNEVDRRELAELIRNSEDQHIDLREYAHFKDDLVKTGRITYIADNAGEIVFDMIFIKVIKDTFPDIAVEVIVRGKPIHNDATAADAEEIGLSGLAEIIGNGTDIPGTVLKEVNRETKESIDKADLIIAKGQGNFETLYGCGKNIYYIFLCKCDVFTKRFSIERYKGIFVNERNVFKIISTKIKP
ncbi:MAG: DUF89 domain-containing protein [Clostridiaceae bacterium]